MPTYQYRCNSCEHFFEVFQSIKDDPIKECEKCGKEVKKVYNSAGIIFKGSGFYVNDYKNAPQKTASKEACNSCAGANTCPAASE